MSTATASTTATTGTGQHRIPNVICPDGKRRTAVTYRRTRTTPTGNPVIHAYVQTSHNNKRVSVTGYLKRAGRGMKFIPHFHGKNSHLLANPPLPVGTRVKLDNGNIGRIESSYPNYLNHTYKVHVFGFKRPVVVKGSENLVVVA